MIWAMAWGRWGGLGDWRGGGLFVCLSALREIEAHVGNWRWSGLAKFPQPHSLLVKLVLQTSTHMQGCS